MSPVDAAFVTPIAELAIEFGIPPDCVLVKYADELRPEIRKPPTGGSGKIVFAVTVENDPFLRGKFIDAGWKHRVIEAGDIFWRAF